MRHQQKKQAIKKQLEMPLAAPKTVHLQAGACCIHISLAYPSVHLPRARGIHQYLEMDLKAAPAIKCEHFMDAFRALGILKTVAYVDKTQTFRPISSGGISGTKFSGGETAPSVPAFNEMRALRQVEAPFAFEMLF